MYGICNLEWTGIIQKLTNDINQNKTRKTKHFQVCKCSNLPTLCVGLTHTNVTLKYQKKKKKKLKIY